MWYSKMDPHPFKKDIGSIYHYDALLAVYENGNV
jgi:hypothetical protein